MDGIIRFQCISPLPTPTAIHLGSCLPSPLPYMLPYVSGARGARKHTAVVWTADKAKADHPGSASRLALEPAQYLSPFPGEEVRSKPHFSCAAVFGIKGSEVEMVWRWLGTVGIAQGNPKDICSFCRMLSTTVHPLLWFLSLGVRILLFGVLSYRSSAAASTKQTRIKQRSSLEPTPGTDSHFLKIVLS